MPEPEMPEPETRRRRARWLATAVAGSASMVVVLVVIVALVVVGGGAPAPAHPAAAVGPVTPRSPVAQPAGYGRPMALAPDPSRPGVWFVDESAGDVSVFFWDAARRTLHRYSLGDPAAHRLEYGIQVALDVAPDGTVWVGASSTLARLDPTTGAVRYRTVPAPPDDVLADGARPVPIQGQHAIESLAADGSGDVAVAMSAASAVVVYHRATGRFSDVALPEGAAPLQVAYLPDGTLGVALTRWTSSGGHDDLIGVVAPGGTAATVDADSLAITPDGSRFVSTGSQHRIQTVSVPLRRAVDDRDVRSVAVSNAQLVLGLPAASLGRGDVLVATTSGFAEVDLETATASPLTLPTTACGAEGASITPRAPADPSKSFPLPSMRCQARPLDFAVDPAGNVWFTSSVDPGVDELAAATLG